MIENFFNCETSIVSEFNNVIFPKYEKSNSEPLFKAVAGNRQTEALESVIFFRFYFLFCRCHRLYRQTTKSS